MKLLGVAFDFLTILKIKASDYEKGDVGKAAIYFPFVGLVIGTLVGAIFVFLQYIVSPTLSAVIAVAVWAGLSGFLHLEGLAGCADAFFCQGDVEKRLSILKESHVGRVALGSVLLYFLMKTAAIEILPVGNPEWAIILVAYASVMGRWVIVFITQITEPARTTGLGAEMKSGFQPSTWYISLLLPVAMTILGSYLLNIHILIAGVLVVVLGYAISLLAKRQLGGFTGAVLGMAVELAELLCLLVFAIR